MDSRLLAGAYSKRYKYIEKEELENLTYDDDLQNNDALAKARRLSQETNKRRKLLAQKRKQEAAREEKRRQEILNKRHQEQKQATEKYQRCHVGNRPRFSPSLRRRGHSPTKSRVDIEEALRLIRGSSTSSAPNEQSREAIQRLHHTQQNGRDPLERSHVRSSRAGSAGQRESHNRPSSGGPLDVSMRAQLMERSMRNLTSSRSRFEQQLEQHQQLLVEQQQKSLHDFNQAIRKEIDADIKVQGLEESDAQDVALQSESLCSLDSLEEGNQSLGSSLQEQQAQRDFRQMSGQQGETFQTHPNNNSGSNSGMQQQQRRPVDRTGRPQSAKVPVSRQQYNAQRQGDSSQHQADTAGFTGPAGNAHIIGPIPQGYYSQSNGVPVSSTPVIQGNLTYYQDSLDVSQQPERHVAIGTALRLPQQPPPPMNQPIKQPPPTLQYDSQLLTHRRFEVRPNQNAGAGCSGSHMNVNQQEVDAKYAATKVSEGLTSASTQNQHPEERPKAHIYAWTSPPPEENEPDQNSSAGQHHHNNNNTTSSYSASMVADRVMATNLHPQTCRTISTAATTTCVYQTVNTAPNKEPAYTQAGISSTVASTHQTSFTTATNFSHVEIPKNQGQKPGSVLTSPGTYPGTTGLKFGSTAPSFYQDHMQTSQHRQQGSSQSQTPVNGRQQNQQGSGKGPRQTQGGSLARGTLGFVDGKLSTINIPQTDPTPKESRVTVVEDEVDGKKEVRSILKKVNRGALKVGGQAKFNVQDSLEIARMHMRNHEHVKRKKAHKKGVRFADLHYPDEVEEDSDSVDSMIDINTAANNTNSSNSTRADSQAAGAKGTAQRPRPASARVTSYNAHRAAAESRSRVPRLASAGLARHPPAARPKAAAHIIMSGGDVSAHNGQHAGGYESGITAHKSQLDKKVMLINNNFMSRLPVYSTTGTTTETPISTAALYSVSGGKVGSTAMMPPTSSASMAAAADFASSGTNGYSKTSRGGKSAAAPTPQATVLPSHSHFSNANAYKAIYNENGMRIDRTPTDDEINNLWQNMRTMLNVSEGKGVAPSSASSAAAGSEQGARPQVQVSHQYIDGAALGIPNGMRRHPGYPNNKPQPTTTTAAANNGAHHQQNGGVWKAEGQAKNGYLQRYSLLQQRRTPASGIGVPCRTNDVVEQTVQPMPLGTNASDPRHPATAVSISYSPREEMSESMAGFLAAEQVVQTHGRDVHDSRVMAAMESAQNQQEIYNSIRQKLAKGGPSALSLEENQLLESLDKLNDRLKVVENRQTSNQQTNNNSNPASHMCVHGSGFRGHQVMTSQSYRQNSGGQRSTARPVSARLLTRPYR